MQCIWSTSSCSVVYHFKVFCVACVFLSRWWSQSWACGSGHGAAGPLPPRSAPHQRTRPDCSGSCIWFYRGRCETHGAAAATSGLKLTQTNSLCGKSSWNFPLLSCRRSATALEASWAAEAEGTATWGGPVACRRWHTPFLLTSVVSWLAKVSECGRVHSGTLFVVAIWKLTQPRFEASVINKNSYLVSMV